MENITELNWTAIGAATVASFVLGMVWYHPAVFGSTWSESAGVEPNPAIGSLVGTLLSTLALALGAAFVMRKAGMEGLLDGLVFGFIASLAFVLPAIIGQWLFMSRLPLFAVNMGFNLLNLSLVGAIIGLMGAKS